MEIIVITQPNNTINEVELIHQLFNDGLMKLHLRKPNCSCDEVRQLIQQINVIHHPKIVIHQYPELLNEFNVAGFHITQFYKNKIESIRQIIKPNQSLSISCHSFDEIQQLSNFDYYFISPVFNSISKKGYESNFSIAEIETGLIKNKDKKIVALGGINKGNVSRINALKFSGAAILGGLWQAENKTEEWKKIILAVC
jgi:thiamine-phosphate pyrophosphorylase